MAKTSIKQAVILAGGLGTRLRPLTNDRPKPMVLVNGRPFSEYLIEAVKKNGIREVLFLLGYLPEVVIGYFGDGSKFGVQIKYAITDVAYKNGTRIKKAAHLLDDTFLLMFGDVWWPLDLEKMFDFYKTMGLPAMMTVYDNKEGKGEFGHKGNVDVSFDGHIIYYRDFIDGLNFRGLDIGSYIFNKEAVDMMPVSDFELQGDFLPQLIERRELAGYVIRDDYYTITTPEFVKGVEKVFVHGIN